MVSVVYQDEMEQRQKLFCLILYGPLVQKHQDFSKVPKQDFHCTICHGDDLGMMLLVGVDDEVATGQDGAACGEALHNPM